MTVTQADRDAAADYVAGRELMSALSVEHIRRGQYDDDDLVTAWTQHRINSTRELVEALEAMRPLVETIASAARTNDEWGRVVFGQTDAARSLSELLDIALANARYDEGEG